MLPQRPCNILIYQLVTLLEDFSSSQCTDSDKNVAFSNEHYLWSRLLKPLGLLWE